MRTKKKVDSNIYDVIYEEILKDLESSITVDEIKKEIFKTDKRISRACNQIEIFAGVLLFLAQVKKVPFGIPEIIAAVKKVTDIAITQKTIYRIYKGCLHTSGMSQPILNYKIYLKRLAVKHRLNKSQIKLVKNNLERVMELAVGGNFIFVESMICYVTNKPYNQFPVSSVTIHKYLKKFEKLGLKQAIDADYHKNSTNHPVVN